MFPDDECDSKDFTTVASDAAAAARDSRASLSEFSREDDESSHPPSLHTRQARSERVVGNQAGLEGAGRKEGGSYDGFRRRGTESRTANRRELARFDDEGSAKELDGEEDETDEELAAGACGTLEEEDVETDEEVEASTWDRKGDRHQPQEESQDADADGVGKGIDNLADDASSPPPGNEMPSKNAQQVELNVERTSADHNEKNIKSSSVTEEERTHGVNAAQGDFAPSSPARRVPQTIQVLGCFHERWQGDGKLEAASYLVEGIILKRTVLFSLRSASFSRNACCPTNTEHHGRGWRTGNLQQTTKRGKLAR